MARSIRDKLAGACDTGEVISIIYHGGSQPGTVREISPITVSETDVRARDLAVGLAKTFKLAKIELAGASTGKPDYDPSRASHVEMTGTIRDVFLDEMTQLESMGWHVQLADEAIAVCRFFKNGKPRKTPDVELSYSEYNVIAYVNLEGNLNEEKQKASRPYSLSSPNFASTKTFKKMASAVSAFRNETRVLAPATAT